MSIFRFDLTVFDFTVFDLVVFNLMVFDLTVFDLTVYDLTIFDPTMFKLIVLDLTIFDHTVFDLNDPTLYSESFSELFDGLLLSSILARRTTQLYRFAEEQRTPVADRPGDNINDIVPKS